MVKNFLIMLCNLKQVHLKLLLNEQFIKKAEATGDLIEKKISDEITKVSRTSQQTIWETVTNVWEYLKKDISPEKRHKIIEMSKKRTHLLDNTKWAKENTPKI